MEKEKIFTNLILSKENTDTYYHVDGLSLQNLFFANNNYFPNCYMFTYSGKNGAPHFDVYEMLKYFTDKYNQDEMEYINYVTRDMDTSEEEYGICIYLKKQNLYARIEKNVSESYVLYSHNNTEELGKFVEDISKFYLLPKEEKNNLYKIAQTNGGYTLIKKHIKEVPNFSVDEQYNDDLKHEDEKIMKFIEQEDKSGLIILHGEKGTGKTTYIRNIITNNSDKRFVFVSPEVMRCFGDPSFTTFIEGMNNNILILEDCENVIRDRANSDYHGSVVSTLLNLTDGLISDDCNIKFICTFNADINDIDTALMRKGRLISKYEFKPLNLEKTKKLLKKLYPDKPESDFDSLKKGLTLADIYGFYEDSYEIERKKII